MTTNKNIRKEIRAKRQRLSSRQQQIAAEQLAMQLVKHPSFQHSQNIACYLATQGELSLMPFIQACWQYNKNVYLPVLQPRHYHPLWFVPFTPATILIPNRYGILEPMHKKNQRSKKIIALDSIFLPLVAFDLSGNRVGMGAGYYDRTLNMLKMRQYWLKPRLIGVGYAFQQVKSIKTNVWDVPMHFISTDKAIHSVKR
ncbi:5-formyltetrahydrofolate cyclo-ligase [hydrothermal vent metagenome]|uniref:5-formyltetrahydrofolate cyclo-ligase n=1 Tax=hydrothermal vent metagenome TaxID=652676 RepID=A0A3B1AJQ1_9ZZZZ